jgi:hypothetical protein
MMSLEELVGLTCLGKTRIPLCSNVDLEEAG